MPGPRTRIDVTQAKALYESGHTLVEVAAIVGISNSQLSKKLRQAGCVMRSRPRQASRARAVVIKDLRERQRLTWEQIGEALGVTGAAACQNYLIHCRVDAAAASSTR